VITVDIIETGDSNSFYQYNYKTIEFDNQRDKWCK